MKNHLTRMTSSMSSCVARGFTLVELLIVITIMLVMVGVAIPTIRLLAKGDKVREAAREVNLFIESARAEAIINGYAGVWLERDKDLNKVTRVFKVKRPAKYGGDFKDVVCYVRPLNVDPEPATGPAFDTTQFEVFFKEDENSLLRVTAGGNQPIKHNDRIQLGGKGPWYQIIAVPLTASPVNGLHANWNGESCYRVTVALNTLSYDSSNQYGGVTANNYLVPMEGETPFLIERAPKISTRNSLQLPKGTFIDLKHSGFAVNPSVDQTVLEPGESLGGNEFANNPGLLAKQFPVLVLFRQDGSVDRVDYQVYPTGATDPQFFTPSSQFPRSNLFLLVASEPDNLDPGHSSLNDLDNLWIMISRTNGTVITADIMTSGDANSAGAARAASRRGARDGQNLTAN